MPTRFTFKARTGGLQQCSLSVLAAILLAAAQATPVLAAGSAEQPARSLGNYRFSDRATTPGVGAQCLHRDHRLAGRLARRARPGRGLTRRAGALPPETALNACWSAPT